MLSAIASMLKRFMKGTPAGSKPAVVPPAGKRKPVSNPPPTHPSPTLAPRPDDENPLPPTEKQLAFAKKMRIKVEPGMSRRDVSELLDGAVGQMKLNREEKHRPQMAPALVAIEKMLDAIAEDNEYALIAYHWRGDIIVDVVEAAGIEFDRAGTPMYHIVIPKRKRDKDLGAYLEWETDRLVPLQDIGFVEAVKDDLMSDDLSNGEPINYQRLLRRGIKAASKLPKRKPAK